MSQLKAAQVSCSGEESAKLETAWFVGGFLTQAAESFIFAMLGNTNQKGFPKSYGATLRNYTCYSATWVPSLFAEQVKEMKTLIISIHLSQYNLVDVKMLLFFKMLHVSFHKSLELKTNRQTPCQLIKPYFYHQIPSGKPNVPSGKKKKKNLLLFFNSNKSVPLTTLSLEF